MKLYSKFLLVALVSLLAFSCDLKFLEEEKKESADPVREVVLGENKIYIPNDFQTKTAPEGDFEGVVVSMDDDEVVGFAAVAYTSRGTIEEGILEDDAEDIEDAFGYNSFSSIGTSVNGDVTIGRYQLDIGYISEVPGIIANQLMEIIGKSTEYGALNNVTSDYSGTEASKFRVIITVKYLSTGSAIKTVAVTSEDNYEANRAAIEAFIDGSNIGTETSQRVSDSQEFTAIGGSNKADFLFVVDNSISMAGEQAAVRDAANVFWTRLASSGLDFMVGVITTDSDELRGYGFTNNELQFMDDVVCGTSGSSTETGIYYSEMALKPYGTVDQAGYPRNDASMSVILLSDEESQYTRRAYTDFDTSNNLFVTNSYRFYSIVNLGDNDISQYDDLSISTGGSIASIRDTSVFDSIMDTIAINASAASSQFILTDSNIISGTIVVTVDGDTVARSTENGFEYNSTTNSIVFYGDALPGEGATVVVSYDVIQ